MKSAARRYFERHDQLFAAGDMPGCALLYTYPLPISLSGADGWDMMTDRTEMARVLAAKKRAIDANGPAVHRVELLSLAPRPGGRIEVRTACTARRHSGSLCWHAEATYFLRRRGASLVAEMIELINIDRSRFRAFAQGSQTPVAPPFLH